MDVQTVIKLAAGAIIFAVCLVGYLHAVRKNDGHELTKKQKRVKKLWFMGLIIGAWFVVGVFITWFSQKKFHFAIDFEMFSERVELFGGFTVAKTTIIAAVSSAVIIVVLVLFRVFAISKFSAERPTSVQNAAEAIVEFLDKYVAGVVGEKAAKGLSPYMLSVALFMIGCAFSELFGLRAPTSDLTCTLALGFMTFFLLNIYGIKKHGVLGRLKSMGGAVPAMRPIMIPLKAVSDFAVPVSLACRLFGNMIGGMMVMDLLKGVLGGYASGLPAIAGLYFNLFHPMIQIYIFITLSLTFINEAME